MKKSSSTPVALFAYARPDHLARTLEGLRENKVPRIYAFCDGPRTPELQAKTEEVRAIVKGIDWCDVIPVFRDKNWGLGPNIRAGVSSVLEQEKRVIVVEDDIVFRPGAYAYVCAALDFYASTPEVMSISMWTPPSNLPADTSLGFFSKRFVCWGWATTQEAWAKHEGEPEELYNLSRKRGIKVDKWGTDIAYMAQTAKARNLWYVGYLLTHFLYNGLSFFPPVSLVDNIGLDGSGENCSEATPQNNIDAASWSPPPSIFPELTAPPKGLHKTFASYFTHVRPRGINALRIFLGKLKNDILKRRT